jgi:hypothetical protein
MTKTTLQPPVIPGPGQPPAPTTTAHTAYTDGYGIASIILAAMMLNIPGLIVGIIGESKAKSENASPVLSRIGWIANLVLLVIGVTTAGLAIWFFLTHINDFKNMSTTAESSLNDASAQTINGGSFTIRAPHSFSETSDTNPDADIAVGNDETGLYLLGYGDNTDDITSTTSVEQYADRAFESFKADNGFTGQSRTKLDAGIIPNPDKLDVVDYRMEATYGISKFVYYDRYIKTENGYYMLTTWTSPSQLDTNLPTMKALLSSFQETVGTSLRT